MRVVLFILNLILFHILQVIPFVYIYMVFTSYTYGFDIEPDNVQRGIAFIAIVFFWLIDSVLVMADIHGGKNHE